MINRTALRNKALWSKSPRNTSAIICGFGPRRYSSCHGMLFLGLESERANVQTRRMHPVSSLFQQGWDFTNSWRWGQAIFRGAEPPDN